MALLTLAPLRPALVALGLVGGFAGAPPAARAQSAVPLEYRVKAAYLVNFTKYVDWPADAFESPADPVTICVLGENPFGDELARAVTGRTTRGRRLEVRTIDGPARAGACHVVFLSYDEWRRHPDVLAALQRRGILTVGETPRFAADGGVIGFVPVERTIRFAVNLAARDRAGLRISSRMLSLATRLFGGRGGAEAR